MVLLTLISLFSFGCSAVSEAPELIQSNEPMAEQSDKSGAASTKEASASAPAPEPTSCVSTDSHPLAEGIAEEFDVEFDQVIDWFCQGSTFDDILLALQTSEMTDEAPEELLEMLNDKTWNEIWDELGVTAPDSSQ